MQVLEDERDRLGVAQTVEQLEQRLEQAKLTDPVATDDRAHAAVVKGRKKRRQLRPAPGREAREGGMTFSDQGPERPEEWSVRKLGVALLERFAAEHERVLTGQPPFKFGDEAGLADARVPAKQDNAGTPLSRFLPGELEFRQFPDPPDEMAAGQPRAHRRSIAGERSRGPPLYFLPGSTLSCLLKALGGAEPRMRTSVWRERDGQPHGDGGSEPTASRAVHRVLRRCDAAARRRGHLRARSRGLSSSDVSLDDVFPVISY